MPAPLGVTVDAAGVNVAVVSTGATSVLFCVFDGEGTRELARIPLPSRTGDVWHGHVLGIGPGALYGLRADGPWQPGAGLRFNPNKLLLDPYARDVRGRPRWTDASFAYDRNHPDRDLSFSVLDSASDMPRCVVTAPESPVPHDRPGRAWRDTVIYEAHVRGLTRLMPDLPPEIRGTYAALGHPAVIAHLQRLGATALELLPIQLFADDPFLVARGLTNYWGYSTINYFTPDPRYGAPDELRTTIRALHAAGIEVILDIVLNHTAEGDELGPTLSFRGLDNAGAYKLQPDNRRYDVNVTGCGNTLDLSQPHMRRFAVDVLRHWADSYGVDGFRFDLAPALAREPDEFRTDSPFFAAVAADPVLSGLKLIAEPWDIGPGGYRLGGFPQPWGEWSDRFRDAARGFWRGDPGALPTLARGLSGSREVFEPSGRPPQASINYVCAHDGFTLRDLVSFEERHNAANGEGNRDGHGHNLSANHGVEGETDNPAINALRRRQMRNLLATAFLAQGVPMLLMGDELGRTQGGNNNPYCQDNATSWMRWDDPFDPDLPAFVARLAALRRAHPALWRTRFLTGEREPDGSRDVRWLAPDGREMAGSDWSDGGANVLGMDVSAVPPEAGRVLLLLNGDLVERAFVLPPSPEGPAWAPLLDSTVPDGRPHGARDGLRPGGTIILPSRSIQLFGSAI